MLTRPISRLRVVAEPETSYNTAIEYEYRDAEYECDEGREPEPWPPPKEASRAVWQWLSLSRVLGDVVRYAAQQEIGVT